VVKDGRRWRVRQSDLETFIACDWTSRVPLPSNGKEQNNLVSQPPLTENLSAPLDMGES